MLLWGKYLEIIYDIKRLEKRVMSQHQIKFSIITVCLNAEDTIGETIDSVNAQMYSDYEYIIWDGVSKDHTLDIVEEHVEKGKTAIFSEKDNGLYNAMNKAVHKCSGDYVLFLNSGDTFADVQVLSDVASRIEKDRVKADIYFGNVFRKREDKTELEKYHGKKIVLRLLLVGRMPCHQSMFTRLEVMKKYGFDESYSITADYNFLMKCHRKQHSIRYIDRAISCFDCTAGISAQDDNLEEMRQQDDRSMKELYPIWFYLLKPVKKAGRWVKDFQKEKK